MKIFASKAGKAFFCLALCLFITGCGMHSPPYVKAEPTKFATWLVYWDLKQGQKDLKELKSRVDELSYFGAYFDENNKLFIPEEIIAQKKAHKKNKHQKYLTFINDKQLADGKMLLKDTALLEELFASEQSMQQHIDEILGLVEQHGFTGIEIDYERLWVKPEIGEKFSFFINKLAYQALKHELKLRVILEPGVPFAKTDFAKGPDYVVMLYNLYGTHSGPGPKADKSFIEATIKKMAALPEEGKSVAFSTGGCIWGTDGTKKFITQQEAEALVKKHKPEVEIDSASSALHFQYNEGGYLYTVWYADHSTLNYWISAAKAMGIKEFALWRLGGNSKLSKLG